MLFDQLNAAAFYRLSSFAVAIKELLSLSVVSDEELVMLESNGEVITARFGRR